MAVKLNKVIVLCFLGLIQLEFFAQSNGVKIDYPDYKNSEQFKNFRKRRKLIGAWQINELKNGALVVRLKTNNTLINSLIKQGNKQLAYQKQLQQYAVNKNAMLAYIDNYKFSKLYFISSDSSNSLLQGKRTNIFLDTNLTVDPSIEMKEKFYLIAERDYAYNSSIGFVKEDTAKYFFETGNPIKERAIVLKNKFGHQLKAPFPYEYEDKAIPIKYEFPISINPNNGISYFYVNKTFLKDRKEENETRKNKSKPKLKENEVLVEVNKMLLYENVSKSVSDLDNQLNYFYKNSPKVEFDKADPILPFLY
ncbi:MAG: hypothetical protein SFY56_05645 [Bacteroidota bacterium]|nr:hypothetical protein [Bacteroidota bacterium]